MLPLHMAHAQPVVSMMYIGGGIRASAAVFFGSEPVGAGEALHYAVPCLQKLCVI